MKPHYVEFDNFSVMAIVGKSGSGKSSTLRFLIAQLLEMDVELFILDPHGRMRDSLTSSIPYPTYIDKDARLRVLRTIYKELLARIEGKEGNKIAIVIDETTAHFLECTPEEVREQATFLLRLANEGRRSQIRVFLAGHNFKQEFIGARSVRSSITHVLYHAVSDDEVKLLTPNLPTKERRMIGTLKRGEAYLYPDLVKLKIPYVSSEELFAQDRTQHSNANTLMHDSSMHVESNVSASTIGLKKANTFAEFVDQVKLSIDLGMGKEESLKIILDTYKSGRNKKWLAGSKVYDRIKERM